MTLEEFRHKRQNIEKLYPAPEGLSKDQRVRYYSKIAQNWIGEMEKLEDVRKAQEEERELISGLLQH